MFFTFYFSKLRPALSKRNEKELHRVWLHCYSAQSKVGDNRIADHERN